MMILNFAILGDPSSRPVSRSHVLFSHTSLLVISLCCSVSIQRQNCPHKDVNIRNPCVREEKRLINHAMWSLKM